MPASTALEASPEPVPLFSTVTPGFCSWNTSPKAWQTVAIDVEPFKVSFPLKELSAVLPPPDVPVSVDPQPANNAAVETMRAEASTAVTILLIFVFLIFLSPHLFVKMSLVYSAFVNITLKII